MTRMRRAMTLRRFYFRLLGLGTLECKGVSSVWDTKSGYLHHEEFLGVAHGAKRLEFSVFCLGIMTLVSGGWAKCPVRRKG